METTFKFCPICGKELVMIENWEDPNAEKYLGDAFNGWEPDECNCFACNEHIFFINPESSPTEDSESFHVEIYK